MFYLLQQDTGKKDSHDTTEIEYIQETQYIEYIIVHSTDNNIYEGGIRPLLEQEQV